MLQERVHKLESQNRELSDVNKVLDIENRVAMAQIINFTDEKQLNNLLAALEYVV